MQSIIEVKNISFSYTNPVLENISFTINQGDFVGILGPNGAGKTTFLKLLLGLLKPQKGVITIKGKPSTNALAHIGYVAQRSIITDDSFPATVYDVVHMGRLGAHNSVSHEDIMHALDIVEMREFANEKISQLSGGQQQRALIARALVRKPKILILDEPTVGVDEKRQKSFFTLLKKINEQFGVTLLFVSHDHHGIQKIASHILVLNKTVQYFGLAKNAGDLHV
jgi:zinc transport system ATP-binding protein